MATYTGTAPKDIVVTNPAEGSSTVAELNDADRETRLILKSQYAVKAVAFADSPYTVLVSDSTILCNCTAGAITVTLPQVTAVSSTTFGKQYQVIKTDSSANAVTIACYSGDTINGASTKTLSTQYYGYNIVGGGGTDWKILGGSAASADLATNATNIYDAGATAYVGATSTATASKAVVADASGYIDDAWLTDTLTSHVIVDVTSDQSLSASTWTTVNFNNEVKDTLNEFNTTTKRFTATETGYYLVNA